ncbi:hypothetical protein BSL78_10141 [Apostichopus japonicus]|uniref:Uncharacterized protein n=1 Tax=Stichopus japonicus TaxID=307972 RepID=A0A2G8KYA3_STIJA|nr:hypothetical protein BSL78_10141 [Apostichopus japonicus]
MMSSDCRTISSRSTAYPPRSIDRRSFKQSRAMKCKEPKRQEGQQRRSFRDCPVPDCPSVLLPRIDKHLQQVHNYKTSSAEYHQLLSAAPDSKKETEEGGKKEEEEEDFLVEMEDTPKDILDIYDVVMPANRADEMMTRCTEEAKLQLPVSHDSYRNSSPPNTSSLMSRHSIVLFRCFGIQFRYHPSGEEKKVPEHPDGSHAAERRTPWLCHHRSHAGRVSSSQTENQQKLGHRCSQPQKVIHLLTRHRSPLTHPLPALHRVPS